MEILQNAYRIPVFSAEQTQEIVNVLNSKEFQEIYSFYAQQIPPESVLNNLPDLEKKFGFYFSYTGQDDYIPQLQSVLYKKHMPSIEEFLKKPEYMGNSWGITYPYWRQKLMEMFKPGTRVFECLSGDTEIPLMSGKTITIRDLYNSGVSDEYVYSWNEDQWKFEPGKIGKVIYNGKRKVYKVTLDNGKSFKVTGNHKILCRNNKWKTVDSLKIGDSLMPFSRYISHKSDKCELEGYECINVPNKTGEFKPEYTHRLSALWKTGMTYSAIAKKCNMKHPVIHHKNFNKLDNRPGNLIYLSGEMQHMYHSRHINEYRNANKEELREKQLAYWQSERGKENKLIRSERFRKFILEYFSNEQNAQYHKERCRIAMQSEARRIQSCLNLKEFNNRIKAGDTEALRILRENTRKGIIARWSDPEQRKLASKKMTDLNNSGNASKAGKARWNKANSEKEKEKLRQLMLIRNKENNPSARNDLTDNDIIDALKSSYSVTEAREKLKCSRTYITSHIEKMGIDPNNLLKPITKELLEELLRDSYTFSEAAEKFGVAARRFRVFTNSFNPDEKQYLKVNHKVISIELLDEEEDVYDIFVDGKYHNFALDVGSIVHNCCYRGCIGSGKTTIARRAALYCIYRLCCLRNPHAMFNIAPDTAISALMISVIMTQAETTVFAPMLQMIRNTPCFKEVRKEASFEAFGPGDPVPFVKNGIRLIFPGNIFLTIGSNINHVIGQSSAIVVMDEAEEKNPQEAFDLYTAMRGRIKSRFLDSSLTMCSLISSSKSKSGMVWEYIKKIPKDDPTVMLMEPPIWDVKASVFDYNKGRFWIQVGTKTNPSVILPSEYDNIPENKLTYVPPPGCRLISVPYEYRRDFENNIEKYLQDYGGITTDTSDRPFDDLSNLGDPGLIPEVHLEASLGDSKPLIEKLPEKLFVNTTRGLMLARYPYAKRYCFTGDTKVKLLSGISKTMIELTEDLKNGVDNYVYSWDIKNNKWCVGKIVNAGITKKVSQLAIVTLDNGEIIKCTPDHKFLLKSGEYKPVSEIAKDESLLALYKNESKKVSFKRKTYEEILNPITNNWVKTYSMSAEYFKENYDAAIKQASELNSWIVIHHKDMNASNNNPDNLIYLENVQHLMLHSRCEESQFAQLWKIDEFRRYMSKVSSESGRIFGKINMINNWNNEKFISKMKNVSAENGRKNIIKYNKSEERRKKISLLCKEGKIGVKKFSKEQLLLGNIRCRRQIIINNMNKIKDLGLSLTKENWENNRYCKNVPRWNKLINLDRENFGDLIDQLVINHKINKVELITLNEPIDVYDITVENKEKTHNFALDAGVVVSNCHIDLASRDASQTGYSLWHIEYIKDEKTGDKIPVYVADFISWITATTRIDHELVNQLALDLKYKAHVNIEAISYDQFQSEAIRQKLKQDREFPHVDYQSVDRTNEAYTLFSQLMLKGQIKVGDCPYLREQLSNIGLEDGKVLTTHKKDMADSCLSFDTKIFLLSGKIVTIEELYRMDLSKEWVLACDTETRKLVPVKIERVIEKHIPDHLLRFHLSNGRSFATTEDHLILMRNSEFVQAEDIKVGDSLMPFNYYHELNYHDRYRKVVNPYTRKAEFLYKLVSKTLLQEKINDAKNRAVLDGSKFTVIHHVNHNKNNDTPENLMPLTNIEHTNLHAMTGREIKAFHDRSVFKRERTKVINKGLNLMKRVNPEGYRRYVIEHDVETKLAERRAKEDNSEITIESIEVIPNNKPVYDIVLNSIHNFALDCNVFVHNCVGSVYNALTYGPNKNTQALLDCPYYCGEELKKTTVEVLGYTNDDYDVEEI